LAGAEGIEPSFTVLEAAILPLEDAPRYLAESRVIETHSSKELTVFETASVTLTDLLSKPGGRYRIRTCGGLSPSRV
jgi:hypothetical protein